MPASAPRLIGVTEARESFKELLEEVQRRDVVFLRHNRPVAMLVKPDRLERLFRRIEDLEDELAVREARATPDDLVAHDEMVARHGTPERTEAAG